MNSGKVLACDAPQKLIEERGTATLEDAFIAYMEDAIGDAAAKGESKDKAAVSAPPAVQPATQPATSEHRTGWFSLIRMLAYTNNETMQIRRDPVRLAFAFIGSALLMLVFGYGITSDVEHVRYASLDLDQSPESRLYLEQFAGAQRYFTLTPPILSADEALERLQSNDVSLVVEVPPDFGRDFRRGSKPDISAAVDGADPFRGETIAQYAKGVHDTLMHDPGSELSSGPDKYTANFQTRFMYNPTFESIYTIVPSIPSLLLVLIPAVLMAVSIVREKELGSIINFYVTPTGRLEYLVGKQIPYIAIGMMNFFILAIMARVVFGVPIKGSFLMLTVCTLLYLVVTTGIGMVISTFTSSQVAAVFVTAILTILPTTQFSGLLQPVSTLEGRAQFIGSIWPTTYYMHSSVGAYTKGLGPDFLLQDLIFLACCIPILLAVSIASMRKQEK